MVIASVRYNYLPHILQIENNTNFRFGMEKWSKEYNTKHKDIREFKDNKILLANVHPNLIQQLKNINEYKQVENGKI